MLQINLRMLRNEEHIQFATDIDRLLQDVDMVEFRIENLYPAFKNACVKEKALLEYVRKSEYTAIIKSNNVVRDWAFRTLILKVKSLMIEGSNPLLRKHAERINICVHHYRKIRSKAITEKNATYRKLIHDLRADYTEQITALSLTEQLSQLESLCTFIENQMDLRQFSRGQRREGIDVLTARRNLEQHYKALTQVIGTALLLDQSPENMAFQEKFNGLVLLYKQALKARRKARKHEHNNVTAVQAGEVHDVQEEVDNL